jgi:hypothetical protein
MTNPKRRFLRESIGVPPVACDAAIVSQVIDPYTVLVKMAKTRIGQNFRNLDRNTLSVTCKKH